jgi:hypothetical protein
MKTTFKEVLKSKFDYDVSEIGTYINQESENIMTDLIYGSGLINRMQVMEEVKGSEKLKLVNLEFDLQTVNGCTMEDNGTIIFHNDTITTVRVGVQFKLCNEDLIGTWAQLLLAIGANRQDREMPLESVITAYTIKMAQKKTQDLILLGDTASGDDNLNIIDGFIKLWDADPDINVANRTGTEITSSNALTNMLSLYDAIPSEVFDSGWLVEIIGSRQAGRAAIQQAYNDKDYNMNLAHKNENGELSFVIPTTDVTFRSYPQFNGASVNQKMYAVVYPLMVFGTDLKSDIDGFFVKYLEDDEELRFGAKWRVGIQYIWSKYFARLANTAS